MNIKCQKTHIILFAREDLKPIPVDDHTILIAQRIQQNTVGISFIYIYISLRTQYPNSNSKQKSIR